MFLVLCSGTAKLYYTLMVWLNFPMKPLLGVMTSEMGGTSLHFIDGDKSV